MHIKSWCCHECISGYCWSLFSLVCLYEFYYILAYWQVKRIGESADSEANNLKNLKRSWLRKSVWRDSPAKMRLVSLVLLITFESLFVNYASSQCVSLNNTLLNNCFQAGFNESEFTKNRSLQNISNLIMSMKTKFDSCSKSLSTLMTCSLHVPRCSSTSSRKLPCREDCKKFVSGCRDVSAHTEGLMALFRGLCDLLPLCTSPSDRLNTTAEGE